MEYIVILVLIGIIYYFFNYTPRLKGRDLQTIKGDMGEVQVNQVLSELNVQDYHFLSNIIIKKPDGSSSQIDHLIVSKYGVFVIETKNYSGVIIGNENDYKWLQIFNKFKKFRFYNPIIQNNGHIEALKQILPNYIDSIYHSIIVFTGDANIDNLYIKTPVVPIERLLQTIHDKSISILDENEVSNIYTILSSTKYTNSLSEDEHINYVKGLGYDNKYPTTIRRRKTKDKKKKIVLVISSVFILYIISLNSYNAYLIRTRNTGIPSPVKSNRTLPRPTTTPNPKNPSEIVNLPSNMQQDNETKNVTQTIQEPTDNISTDISLDVSEIVYNSFIDAKIDVSQFSLTFNSSNGYTLKFSLKNNSDYIYKLRENSQVVVNLDNGDILTYDMYGVRRAYDEQQLLIPGQEMRFIPFDINDLNANIKSIALINNDLEDSIDTNKIIKENYIIMLKEEDINILISDSDLSDKIFLFDLSLVNDLNGSNLLRFSVANKSEYILRLREDTQIVITYENDIKVKYDVFGERLTYSINQMLKPGASSVFKPFELLDDNSDIQQIELVNTDLIDKNDYSKIAYKNYTIEWSNHY